MRYVFALTPLVVFAWLPVVGQQNAQAVRTAGAELTAPVLIQPTPTVSTPKHCDELDGVVKFSALVDAAGLPHELREIEASDRRLVDFATELVETQRFKPATLDGSPTTAFIVLTVGLHTCAQREKDPSNQDFYRFTLRSHPLMALAVVAHPPAEVVVLRTRKEAIPTEQVGEHISAPVPTVIIDPEIPVTKKLPKRGFCLVGVTIDASGLPQNIRVVRSLEPELDDYAKEAAKSWRFKPALRDGNVPIAVEGTIVANFRDVDKEPVAYAIFVPEAPEKIDSDIARHGQEKIAVEVVNGDEVSARYMPRRPIPGHCLVSLVIDAEGLPHNVHIVKGIDSSLDMDTVAMVEHSRFEVTTPDGTDPASVGLIISMHYRNRVAWRDLIADLLPFAI